VVPFSMVVLNVLRHGAAEVPLPDRNQPVQTFFFDRPHEPLCVRIRIGRTRGRENHAGPSVPQLTLHLPAPLPIPIANQDVQRGPRAGLAHCQRPHDLLHEHDLGMRRRSEDLHASGCEVDDEHGVERDQPSPGPHFGSDERAAPSPPPAIMRFGSPTCSGL
jgi:hypothetical protein